MFRKITSGLADPNIPNHSVSAILGFGFGAVAFLAYARADGALTSTLSTLSIASFVWATNQFLHGNARNHQVFFQPVEHTPAELDLEVGYSRQKKAF